MASHDCYRNGNLSAPQRCVPEFINAAFNREVISSNTCGTRQPSHYCSQISLRGNTKICSVCDDRVSGYNHPTRFLTDFNNPDNETWWQSDTMLDGIQYPNNVTLTLVLGKAYDITYVRLKFVSPRPESFAIYKKTTADGEWIPWQFYSGSCKSTYKMPEKAPILPGNEAVAQCTREFSDISPLTGGNIAFSTLDGRPSAENFEESEVLQQWVTAVAIRIVLNRLNTFGDEVFQDQRVLKTYYYAISDFTVGGRCKCNGHANSCVASTGEGVGERLVCQCQHNTDGPDCERCLPFFQDRPWRRGTAEEPNECLPCNCNGLSSRCFFDEALFNATGHGGHCVDCTGNTGGPNCEKCLPGFYKPEGYHFCQDCKCHPTGSYSEKCNEKGECECKTGVKGGRCEECAAGFYDFSASGCKDCHCEVAGSWGNEGRCSALSGECQCKMNVEGQKCDKCKPGYFNLSPRNHFGCTPCFCFGHSSVCSPAEGFFATNISSVFLEGVDKWTASSQTRLEDVQWAQLDQAVAISQIDYYPVYYEAPSEFLGDLRFSFGQELIFKLRVQLEATAPSNKDLIIMSNNDEELTIPITGQGNPLPSTFVQTFKFQLHPKAGQWSPNLSEIDFLKRLSNVTAIKIRGTYSRGDVGFLNFFTLSSASDSSTSAPEADWIEVCNCPEGHIGQFCESCAPGYRRAVKFGGPLTKCIKCDCHGHSDSCDAESGACICQHNTAGDTCETCARGYYGNALNGTQHDCQKCDCPENGPCALLPEGGTVCTECPIGYSGIKCEYCASEYYGNPSEGRPCLPCPCNGNIDYNAIGNCDSFTGKCKKCIYNTTGFHCEKCLPGFWGDPKKEPKNDCRECGCYPPGTRMKFSDYDFLECDQATGQCGCLPHVTGLKCDQCEPGFFNITSGQGCLTCGCHPLGSEDQFCNTVTGQCKCKSGVTGLKCDKCASKFFNFSNNGCKSCDCDPIGSEIQDCDVSTGQCLCRNNVEGRRCDQCSENRFNMRAGCLPCDDCYTLIQFRKNELVEKIKEVETGLDYWENTSVEINDESVFKKIEDQQKDLEDLKKNMNTYLDEKSVSQIKSFLSLIPRTQKAISAFRNHRSTLNSITSTLDELEVEYQEFEKIKSAYNKQLDRDFDKAEKDKNKVLEEAQEKLALYGDYDKTLFKIATEVNELARRHQKTANEIRTKSEKYQKDVKAAHNEAHNAVHGNSTSSKVHHLQKLTDETAALLNRTKTLLSGHAEEAERAHTNAAKALAEIEELKIPEVDVDSLKTNAKATKETIKEEKRKLENLLNEEKRIKKTVTKAITEAKNQIRILERKNKNKNTILHQIEVQKNKTQNVIEDVVDAMAEARKILIDLENFDENNEKNKKLFLNEVENVPATRETIQEVNKITKGVKNELGNSKATAEKALNLIREAQDQIELLTKQIDQILEAVDALELSIKESEKEIDIISRITDALERAQEQEKKLEEIKESNQVAGRKAAETEMKARKGNETLDELEQVLESVQVKLRVLGKAPSEEELNRLEDALDKAEKAFKAKKIRRDIKRLKNAKMEEERNLVKSEYEHIKEELDQMRRIYESLPSKCYNIVRIEQR